MIFGEGFAGWIAGDTKTLHVIPAPDDGILPRWAEVGRVETVQVVKSRQTIVRGVVTIRRRPGPAICHIRFTALGAQALDPDNPDTGPLVALEDLEPHHALELGFPSYEQFLEYWASHHPLPEDGPELVLLARFERVQRDTDRFLAPAGSGADYTSVERVQGRTVALPDERPHTVVPEHVQEQITADATRRAAERHAREQKDRELLDAERRVADVQRAAVLKGVVIAREIRLLNRMRPGSDAHRRQLREVERKVHEPGTVRPFNVDQEAA